MCRLVETGKHNSPMVKNNIIYTHCESVHVDKMTERRSGTVVLCAVEVCVSKHTHTHMDILCVCGLIEVTVSYKLKEHFTNFDT